MKGDMKHGEEGSDMNWKDKRVVVTGGGGFIGSHLTERLLREGAVLRALLHGDPRTHAGHLSQHLAPATGQCATLNLELLGGDLGDASFVRRAVDSAAYVFHLGAVTSVAYSYANPEETIRTNALGTLNVCEALRGTTCTRLIHTSTAGVYGNARDDAPMSEDHPVGGWNPYVAGKLAGDQIVQSYHVSYGIPLVTVRLFNVYGPRMGRYLIMPTIIEQLLRGPDLRVGDLSPTRTFTFVDDIVDGYLQAAAAEGVDGETIHFGSERVLTMAEVVDQIAQLLGVTPIIHQDPHRIRPAKSEIYRVRVNSEKARRLLAWTPAVELEEGLRRTIEWIRAQPVR